MGNRAALRDCPVAPPEHSSVHARALHRACLIVGGLGVLAARMDVPAEDLDGWMRGQSEAPEHVFREAVEIILLYASTSGGAS
jgi:hypothetical protein